MHRSQHLFETIIKPRLSAPGVPCTITASEAAALSQRLQEDANDYFYSAAVSLASACLALRAESYTWAAVKLYYATYLAARSTLAANNVCVVFQGKKRIYSSLRAQAGMGLEKLETNTNTHASVISCFLKYLPSHEMNTQKIAGQHAITWIKRQRERLNYSVVRFADPLADALFAKCTREDYRKWISAYLTETFYAYDPDHAILALPVRALQTTREQFSKRLVSYACRNEESHFLRAITNDRLGPIPGLIDLICK